MKRIIRISLTLPPPLLEKLDNSITEIGYPNRSKAIQDALTSFIANHEKLLRLKGVKTGLITVLYDHSSIGLEESLNEIQHHYRETIISTMHVHLSKQYCLEAIAVKGDISDIMMLLNKVKSEKGVLQSNLNTV
jgi:CopG family nickel-responsive transcriptional regulator